MRKNLPVLIQMINVTQQTTKRASQVSESFDITTYIASNTQVRFVRNGNVKRRFRADNIEIAWN